MPREIKTPTVQYASQFDRAMTMPKGSRLLYSIKAIPRPMTAPPNAPLTLPAAPGNSEAVGVASGVLVAGAVPAVVLAPPGVTNWAVVAIAGMRMSMDPRMTPEVKGTSVPTAVAPEKAGVGVTAGAGLTSSCAGLSTLCCELVLGTW